jgi:hypothetical protein
VWPVLTCLHIGYCLTIFHSLRCYWFRQRARPHLVEGLNHHWVTCELAESSEQKLSSPLLSIPSHRTKVIVLRTRTATEERHSLLITLPHIILYQETHFTEHPVTHHQVSGNKFDWPLCSTLFCARKLFQYLIIFFRYEYMKLWCEFMLPLFIHQFIEKLCTNRKQDHSILSYNKYSFVVGYQCFWGT